MQVMNISYPRILHREMQLGGEIGQETEYLLGMEYDHVHPVKLSFDSDRVLFLAVENEFYEITIDKTGRVTKRNLLIQLNAVHERFYNIWEPVLLKDGYLVCFNFANGDGYLVIKQGTAVGCWIRAIGSNAYNDVLSGQIICLESNSLVLTNIQKISDHKCALIYSKVAREALDECFKISILNQS